MCKNTGENCGKPRSWGKKICRVRKARLGKYMKIKEEKENEEKTLSENSHPLSHALQNFQRLR